MTETTQAYLPLPCQTTDLAPLVPPILADWTRTRHGLRLLARMPSLGDSYDFEAEQTRLSMFRVATYLAARGDHAAACAVFMSGEAVRASFMARDTAAVARFALDSVAFLTRSYRRTCTAKDAQCAS